MNLEQSHTQPRAAYSINEFCEAHGVSRATYYNWQKAGVGPREMEVIGRKLISVEAAADWRREREAAAASAKDEAA
ncbi:MAG TPA: hypothetical protein VMP03_09820 [Methylomirabilota bacterium]|nr:hypothetical protein [Methylomirabilota bacterium]